MNSDRNRGSDEGRDAKRRWARRRAWVPLNKTNEPTPVRDALDNLAATMGLASVDGINRLFLNWPEIVGDELATKCSPKRLQAGELVVEAVDRQWATELSFMTQLIADRCNEALGEGAVVAVKIARVSG